MCSGECLSLYVRKATQPLQKHVAQCSKARNESAVHLHLKEKGHEDALVHILNHEDRWFDREVKETSSSSVNNHQWTVLWWPMTPISSHYCPVLRSLPKQLNLPLHFDPCDLTDWHDDSICHWLSVVTTPLGIKDLGLPISCQDRRRAETSFWIWKRRRIKYLRLPWPGWLRTCTDKWTCPTAKESCHLLSLCSGQGFTFSLYVEQNTSALTDLSLIMSGDV